MYIPFEQMPGHARVWVYQSVKPLDAATAALTESLEQFARNWESHGIPLRASFRVLHDHFIVLAVDETAKDASGCSIDKSVHFMQGLEGQFGLSLFDRSQQAFLVNGQVKFVEVKNLKAQVQAGAIGPETSTFNTLVATVGQLQTEWLVPAAKGWLARYFRQVPQA
ncbi:MAG: hypothetical protein AVDCRST_MAG56-3933 [uncultured Cytophagales bacterium]|uniref:ABC transporter ATPase n=1 Tax=uncultured Cytophagales bacterium TaxID=158755 RepID=A0A6J4JPE2_9SPHI|nr:MAG: hypothetical protein AVDCRST_MAG56-3933 [uncultured Cytophagales bacterium]